MKLRHAAALTLIGWYLMVPPLIPGTGQVNQGAPLSQWTNRRTFPHNQGCEATKAKLHDEALAAQAQRDSTGRQGERDPNSRCVLCNAQCVESTDPRLAK